MSATAQALCLVFLGLVNLSVFYIFWALQLDCYYRSTTVSVAVAATVAVADAVADAIANELQLLLKSLCFLLTSRAAIERLLFLWDKSWCLEFFVTESA